MLGIFGVTGFPNYQLFRRIDNWGWGFGPEVGGVIRLEAEFPDFAAVLGGKECIIQALLHCVRLGRLLDLRDLGEIGACSPESFKLE